MFICTNARSSLQGAVQQLCNQFLGHFVTPSSPLSSLVINRYTPLSLLHNSNKYPLLYIYLHECCDVTQESHPRRLRPLRVAAQRQRELMCILSYVDGIEQWLDEQGVIIDQFHPVPTTTLETGTPIISTSREPL